MNLHLTGCSLLLAAALQSVLAQAPSSTSVHGNHPPLPKPSNLQVLPKDMENKDLIQVMIGFAQGLGVGCPYCHAEKPGVDPAYDLNFASDAKPQKQTARVMLRMVNDINGKYLTEIATDRHDISVTCGNCHLGHAVLPVYQPSGPPPE